MRSSKLLNIAVYLLHGVGLFLLFHSGYAVVEAWRFQRESENRFAIQPKADRRLLGRLVIERLKVSVMVSSGTGQDVLAHAAGHIAGTALPGRPGNVGISAHRDTFFRPLRRIRERDIVQLTTRDGTFFYRVQSISIVGPEDVDILSVGQGEGLTLVTCYPFSFIGAAPERFIVWARRILQPE